MPRDRAHFSSVPFTEKLVASTDGTPIFARAAGDPTRPSIVFVHGFALSSFVWSSLFRNHKLLEHFYLVAFDLRGHGRSGKPDTVDAYSSKLIADDFAAVVKEFKLTRPMFVGWSLGGSCAADIIAHQGTDAISAIVCTAALPYLGAQVLTKPLLARILPGMQNLDNSTVALASRVEFTEMLFTNNERVPPEVMWSWVGSACLVPPAVAPLVSARTQDTTNLLRAGAEGFPVLVINGEADKVNLNDELVKEMEGKFKSMEVYTVKNGGHAMFYEEENEYVDVLLKFALSVVARC